MPPQPVDAWLRAPTQPAIRYLALTQLDGLPEGDAEVRAAKEAIGRQGWAAEILAEQNPDHCTWGPGPSYYRPKYISTNWKLLVLADLGMTREHPAVLAACERWMSDTASKGGGVGANSVGTPHHCVAGNMARALIQMGYEDDPRVHRTLEWIVESADPKGGWSCFGRGRNLDSWEGLSALAAYPKRKRTAAMQRCADAGAEFFLERELHRQGGRYEPWYRFHYPVHYYYDLLVGLELLTSLGYSDDPRLRFALDHLREKRRSDGRWNLDAVHPDVDGGMARWFAAHPKERPIPFALERAGAPSKMITLRALVVLARAG